jgi:hypothetical protein
VRRARPFRAESAFRRLVGNGESHYRWRMHRLVLVLLIAACSSAPAPRPAPRAAIEPPAQGADHRYRVTDAGRLVIDGAAFADLARRLRPDLERDLASGAVRDAEGLRDRWFLLALLDALDDRWDRAVASIDRAAALETDPADRAMTGLTIRVWADAIAHGGDAEAFRAALERKLSTLPTNLVRGRLAMLRAMGQVFSPDVCRKLVDDAIGAHLHDGTLSLDQAQAIAFQRYAVVRLVPVGAVIDQVLGAHGIEPAQ